jgi:hypothetical protein
MKKLPPLQLLGPVALFVALAAADLAAYALQLAPDSKWLWYVNLRWFDMFQRTHYALQAVTGQGYGQFVFIALPLLGAGFIGLIYKRSLLLALSSNLSFIYILFVAIVWAGFKPHTQASLSGAVATSDRPDLLVLAPLVGFSLVSFIVSHVVYLARVRVESA